VRFHSDCDKRLFLLEVGRVDLLDKVKGDSWEPSSDLVELFIKGRQSLIPKLKDFRRSQATKSAWRHHRPAFLKGIRTFHRSTAGKRFHRTLGRWLATRLQDRDKFGSIYSLRNESLEQRVDLLRAITSIMNYAFQELEFYHDLYEELDYWEFLEELFPIAESIERKLFSGEDELTEEEIDVLARMVEDDEIVASVAEAIGRSREDVWNRLREVRSKSESDEEIGWGLRLFQEMLSLTEVKND